jgi:hypothetical protein
MVSWTDIGNLNRLNNDYWLVKIIKQPFSFKTKQGKNERSFCQDVSFIMTDEQVQWQLDIYCSLSSEVDKI